LIRAAAPLHDIGKVGVPDRVLLKPGRLTDDEFALMRTHVALGLGVLDGITEEVGQTAFLRTVRQVIAGHHERWDGRGYPAGLAGEDIPLPGRIMAVADVYDALRSRRVYKAPMSREEARRIIIEGAGAHFDARIVSAFLLVEPEMARIAETLSDETAAAPASCGPEQACVG
jgi:HD-GYP domain-containing protein (c-di-GMP phosphodiesterase class II)